MPPTLHHVPRTISSPIVQILLELDGVHATTPEDYNQAANYSSNDVVVCIHELTSFAQLKEAPHLAINPMGTSPALHWPEVDDLRIWESGAVLDVLLAHCDAQHAIHPSSKNNMAVYAKYRHVQQYILATVYPFVASLFLHCLKPAAEQDAAYIQEAKKKWTTLMGPILTKWLNNQQWMLGGSRPSVVDYLLVKPLGNAHSLGLLETDFPYLFKLYQILSSRPSYIRAYVKFAVPLPVLKEASEEGAMAEEPARSLLVVPNPGMAT